MTTIRVLLAEHNDADFATITRLLARSTHEHCTVERAVTPKDALHMWNDVDYDVCIVDEHDDPSIGVAVRAHIAQRDNSIPLLLLTDGDEPPPDAFAPDITSVEYLSKKDWTTALLIHAIRHTLEHRRFVEACQREARFRTAFEGNLDAIFFYEAVRHDGKIVDFRFTDLNAPAEDMMARPAHEVIGKTQLEIAPGSRASGTIDKMISIVTTGVPIEEHVNVSIPSIAAKWVHRQMVRLGDGLVASARDITTQKQSEASLAEARDLMAAVLEAASDAFVMCAPDGQIMLTNRAAGAFFGLCEHDLANPASLSTEQMFRQVEDAPTFLAQLSELLDAPEHEAKGEIEVVGVPQRTLVWTSNPVRGANTAIIGRVLVFRDATKEREADRLKTEFIGRVSHELRTPLTSIKGFVELILEGDAGPINEDVHDFLSIANYSTELLISIVNDILDITRIDAQKVMLERRLVNVEATARHVAQSLQPLITSRRQHLAIEVPAHLPAVYADAERFNQIMINLLNNAHKYTPDGGSIKVWARMANAADLSYLAPDVPDVPMVVIGVEDTGVGIAPAHQVQIFQRFYRIDSLATQQASGTGLGLSIVRSLVELHGGTIWVESVEGQGSTFAFLLPTMLSTHPAPAIPAEAITA